MYPYPYRRRQSGTLLPFLILIVVGLTLVLGFQIFQHFREERQKLTENKAALTVMKGRVEMKIWGGQEFVPARTGAVLREGDSIEVFPLSRASLALLNGSFLRADEDTAFQFTDLQTKDNHDELTISLASGDVWFRKPKTGDVQVVFTVETEDFTVTSSSTVFAVSKRDAFRVAVLDGNVTVHVKETDEKGRTNIIESVQVGVGQEFVASSETLKEFRDRKFPDPVLALSDSFRASEWYLWNRAEDSIAIDRTVTVEEAATEERDDESSSLAATISPQGNGVTGAIQAGTTLPAPIVIDPPADKRTKKETRFFIRGTTSPKTQKMVVKTFVGGKEDSYALQKYVPGSSEWNYIVDETYGNWVPGKNRFQIFAFSVSGRPSTATELVLTYEKPKQDADLSAPEVTSFGGSRSLETTEDSVKVEGKIGKGIVKMFVNDFSLTRYIPDSRVWAYYAKTEYGNLKEGVNEYEVYGMDADGRKTPMTKFTIVKTKASETSTGGSTNTTLTGESSESVHPAPEESAVSEEPVPESNFSPLE